MLCGGCVELVKAGQGVSVMARWAAEPYAAGGVDVCDRRFRSGRIDRIAYRPGIFINAELDKASEDNERNSLVISTPNGRIGVIQIAGLVARRIVSFVREGQSIGAGERFGLIRFGSRLDVYLPEGTKALVSEGQTAVAGETILADFKLGDGGRTYRAD